MSCNDTVVIPAAAPDIADVVITAITKRKKAAPAAAPMERKCIFRACRQLKTIGTKSSRLEKSEMPLKVMLSVSIAAGTMECGSILAKLISINGSMLGGLIALEEQAKAVTLSL